MNMRMKMLLGQVILFNLVLTAGIGFCQLPAGQTAGGITRQDKDIQKKKELEKKIESARPGPDAAREEVVPEDAGPRVKIDTIKVEGAVLLPPTVIDPITGTYQGRELSFREMQKIADLITDEYRKKGYATSRAYLPLQNVKQGILIIRVVEGKLGSMQIKGNRHFKTSLLEKKMDLGPSGYFDYSALQRAMVYINEHPDRKASATLVPGTAPGSTDVIVDVKDRLPVHVGFEYDNYGSRYINRNRYALVFEHNNLLGFDDKLFLKGQAAESDRMYLQQGRYSFFPLESTEFGAYFVNSKVELGKEFEDLDSEGKAQVYGLFLNHQLLHDRLMDLRLTAGFDYKRLRNYQLGSQISRDNVRVLKAGGDLDLTDDWGRNIFNVQVDQGIPDIMGGMKAKDELATRAGSGGKFTKGLFNIYRLQSLPMGMSFLWENNAQYTNYALVASEQFQMGGPGSVRGYAPAEYSGDSGFYTSPELSIPVYFLPKDVTVPRSDVKWYDANRLVVFFDYAQASLNNPQAGEKKHPCLKGWGFGWRLNIKDNLTFRVEVGYPIGDEMPSDGDHAHPWVELTTKF
ncbi:MAG TPA: ShlB/FhaC/HecB family hemolysin secretion/activation protein [Candidatus Omnitrophota bacterium]|nr:ShlB/FhaC/HecB family hemolysin secretion/activation protein [Candidatus Omnitrophota bacterium]